MQGIRGRKRDVSVEEGPGGPGEESLFWTTIGSVEARRVYLVCTTLISCFKAARRSLKSLFGV
jgi:hypothetical protein